MLHIPSLPGCHQYECMLSRAEHSPQSSRSLIGGDGMMPTHCQLFSWRYANWTVTKDANSECMTVVRELEELKGIIHVWDFIVKEYLFWFQMEAHIFLMPKISASNSLGIWKSSWKSWQKMYRYLFLAYRFWFSDVYFHNSLIPSVTYLFFPLERKEVTLGQNWTNYVVGVKVN